MVFEIRLSAFGAPAKKPRLFYTGGKLAMMRRDGYDKWLAGMVSYFKAQAGKERMTDYKPEWLKVRIRFFFASTYPARWGMPKPDRRNNINEYIEPVVEALKKTGLLGMDSINSVEASRWYGKKNGVQVIITTMEGAAKSDLFIGGEGADPEAVATAHAHTNAGRFPEEDEDDDLGKELDERAKQMRDSGQL